MTKAMISQPMAGLTEQQIRDARRDAEQYAASKGYTVVDSVLDLGNPEGINLGLFYLSKSLTILAECEVLIMCPGWDKARGCRIEKLCAEEYGLRVECL